MNKNDLISHVAAETSATRTGAERMVAAVFSAIGDALARNEPVSIAGFGKFVMRNRGAARAGRNPQTGEPVVAIAASRVPAIQGREGPLRRGQRIAWRPTPALRPGNAAAPHERLRPALSPKRSAGIE